MFRRSLIVIFVLLISVSLRAPVYADDPQANVEKAQKTLKDMRETLDKMGSGSKSISVEAKTTTEAPEKKVKKKKAKKTGAKKAVTKKAKKNADKTEAEKPGSEKAETAKP